jgi:hypothetical protein
MVKKIRQMIKNQTIASFYLTDCLRKYEMLLLVWLEKALDSDETEPNPTSSQTISSDLSGFFAIILIASVTL